MGKHHEVSMKDFEGFTKDVELSSSFGSEFKTLVARIDFISSTITYKVMSHGEIVFNGDSLEKAIEVYNEVY